MEKQSLYVIDADAVRLEEEWTVAILSLSPDEILMVTHSQWYEA